MTFQVLMSRKKLLCRSGNADGDLVLTKHCSISTMAHLKIFNTIQVHTQEPVSTTTLRCLRYMYMTQV